MRYHYNKPTLTKPIYGTVYICNHPVYDKCTLFQIGEKGLAVIQQRFDPVEKRTYWTDVDYWVSNDIYTNPNFLKFFEERSGAPDHGIYPTVSVRQIMWALKMKPIQRERWETCFDRRCI